MKRLLMIVAVIVLLAGCYSPRVYVYGEINEAAKKMIFSDKRGYDEKIIKEDIEKLDKAIRENPNETRLYLARGFIYAATHRYKEAIEDFKKAETLPEYDVSDPTMPKWGTVNYWLGLAYWQSQDYDKAIENLTKTLWLNPEYWPAIYYRALAYWEKWGLTPADSKESNERWRKKSTPFPWLSYDEKEWKEMYEGKKEKHVLARFVGREIYQAWQIGEEKTKKNPTKKDLGDPFIAPIARLFQMDTAFSSYITGSLARQGPLDRNFDYVWQLLHPQLKETKTPTYVTRERVNLYNQMQNRMQPRDHR